MKRKRSKINYFEILPNEIIQNILLFVCFPYCRLISEKFKDFFDNMIENKKKYSILNIHLNFRIVKSNKIYFRYDGVKLIQKNYSTPDKKIFSKIHSIGVYTCDGEIFNNNKGYDQHCAKFNGKNIELINIGQKYITRMNKNLKDPDISYIYLLRYNNIKHELLIPIHLLIDKILIVSENLIYYTILSKTYLYIFMNENKLKNTNIYRYNFKKKIYKYHIYLSFNNKILNILILDEPNENSNSNLSHISIIV